MKKSLILRDSNFNLLNYSNRRERSFSRYLHKTSSFLLDKFRLSSKRLLMEKQVVVMPTTLITILIEVVINSLPGFDGEESQVVSQLDLKKV